MDIIAYLILMVAAVCSMNKLIDKVVGRSACTGNCNQGRNCNCS